MEDGLIYLKGMNFFSVENARKANLCISSCFLASVKALSSFLWQDAFLCMFKFKAFTFFTSKLLFSFFFSVRIFSCRLSILNNR